MQFGLFALVAKGQVLKNIKYFLLLSLLYFSCQNTKPSKENEENKVSETQIKKHELIRINKTRSDTVYGLFSSAHKRKLIYIKPFTWDSNEGSEGALYLKNFENLTNKKLLDSVDTYGCFTDILNESSFLISSHNILYRYSVDENDKRVFFDDKNIKEYIKAIKLSPDKKNVAIVTWDISVNKINFSLLDIATKKVIYKRSWDNNFTDGDEGAYSSIYWVGNDLVFNINNSLYTLNLKNQLIKKISSTLAFNTDYQFTCDSTKVVFFETDSNTEKVSLKYYNIRTKKFVIITCNILQNPITLNDKINLKTGIIDNVRIVFLSIGSKKYKLNNESWQVVKDLYFFKDGYMTISELNNENKKIIKIDY